MLHFIAYTLLCLAAEANGKLKLDPLVLDRDFEADCMCSVSDKNNNTLLVDKGQGDTMIIKINGKIVKLTLKKTTQNTKEKPKIGDEFIKIYTGIKTEVEARFWVLEVCPKDRESCEVTKYKSSLKVKFSGEELQLDGLTADCGC